jgi:hypothetical protein
VKLVELLKKNEFYPIVTGYARILMFFTIPAVLSREFPAAAPFHAGLPVKSLPANGRSTPDNPRKYAVQMR